jgi:predicted O-methyltransferase YrrM
VDRKRGLSRRGLAGRVRQQGGAGKLARRFLQDPKGVIAGSLFHTRMIPALIEFQRGSQLQTLSPEELMADLFGRAVDAEKLHAEFAEVQQTLAERYKRPLPFRMVTRLSDAQSFLLYSLVRELRPSTVLETGVANGHSSVVLLQALQRNGSGTLWSVDISPEVGVLVDPSEKANWKLRLLPIRGERAAFHRLLDEIGPVDLFEHDSDHSYEWQTFEMQSIWPRLRPHGLLSVDDADVSWATLDFARKAGAGLRTLVTTSRVCGVFQHP